MPELSVNEAERSAVADELRRYGWYRDGVGDDLLDAHVMSEPGFPDPPGITPAARDRADSHFAVADACEDLATSIESPEPTPLRPGALSLIEEALDMAYPDELPAALGRVAMFVRLARRQVTETTRTDHGDADELIVVNEESQPLTSRRVADPVAAARLDEARTEQNDLRAQVRQLTKQVGGLHRQVREQAQQLERLRAPGERQRRTAVRNPFAGLDTTSRRAGRGMTDAHGL